MAVANGFSRDLANTNLDINVGGTTVATFDDASNDLVLPTNGLTVTAGGITVTAGDLTVTAGDAHVIAQNLYMGAEVAFATTEPTLAVIFRQGTTFVGAIATGGAIQSNGTVLRKVIADGTVNNIET